MALGSSSSGSSSNSSSNSSSSSSSSSNSSSSNSSSTVAFTAAVYYYYYYYYYYSGSNVALPLLLFACAVALSIHSIMYTWGDHPTSMPDEIYDWLIIYGGPIVACQLLGLATFIEPRVREPLVRDFRYANIVFCATCRKLRSLVVVTLNNLVMAPVHNELNSCPTCQHLLASPRLHNLSTPWLAWCSALVAEEGGYLLAGHRYPLIHVNLSPRSHLPRRAAQWLRRHFQVLANGSPWIRRNVMEGTLDERIFIAMRREHAFAMHFETYDYVDLWTWLYQRGLVHWDTNDREPPLPAIRAIPIHQVHVEGNDSPTLDSTSGSSSEAVSDEGSDVAEDAYDWATT